MKKERLRVVELQDRLAGTFIQVVAKQAREVSSCRSRWARKQGVSELGGTGATSETNVRAGGGAARTTNPWRGEERTTEPRLPCRPRCTFSRVARTTVISVSAPGRLEKELIFRATFSTKLHAVASARAPFSSRHAVLSAFFHRLRMVLRFRATVLNDMSIQAVISSLVCPSIFN